MTGLVVGIGARRGVRADAVRALLARVAREHELGLGLGLDGAGLDGTVVATVESKCHEPGLLGALAPSVPVGVPAAVLAGVEVPHPSDRVALAVGTPGVAEAAALHTARGLAGGGEFVTLIVPKTAGDGVTVAVARYHRP